MTSFLGVSAKVLVSFFCVIGAFMGLGSRFGGTGVIMLLSWCLGFSASYFYGLVHFLLGFGIFLISMLLLIWSENFLGCGCIMWFMDMWE